MSLSVNTNIAALDAHRNLVGTTGSLQTSMERLSSGYRINSAADDAAGLGISEKMRGQISGLAQAQRKPEPCTTNRNASDDDVGVEKKNP